MKRDASLVKIESIIARGIEMRVYGDDTRGFENRASRLGRRRRITNIQNGNGRDNATTRVNRARSIRS